MNIKLIIIIILCVLAGLALCLFLGYMGIVPFDVFYAMVAGWFGNFDVQGIVENPASLVTIAGTGITTAVGVGVPLLNQANNAKKQLQDTTEAAKTKIGSLSSSLEDTTSKLETTELDLTNANSKISELEPQINQYKTQADTYKEQLDKLTSQYTELQKLKTSDLIGSLPAGTTMPNSDGSKTVVVEKTVVK